MSRRFYPWWACQKFVRFLCKYGPREAAVLIRKNIAQVIRLYLNRRFDRNYNVDTSGVVQLSELTCEGNNQTHGVWYEPTPLRTLECMFSLLPSDVSEFTFIDFGSGKGRTLVYASTFNFKRILGVEFTRELHAVAMQNIRTLRNKLQRCFNLTSVCADAASFSLPDDNCVLYFFHPFREEVMARVLTNIEESYRRNPRKLILLYYHPQLNDLIKGLTFVRKTGEKTMPIDISGEPCIYRRKLEVYETMSVPTAPLPSTAKVSR
jgi:16S rRNA G966 N2-methylase RsmD